MSKVVLSLEVLVDEAYVEDAESALIHEANLWGEGVSVTIFDESGDIL